MTQDFIMGMIAGFFIGVGFCLIFTNILAYKMIRILGTKLKKDETTFDADDPVNYWKPKGWKPDEPDEL